jgi:threonine/homoserine/homoserine lactone efflux protein
MFTLSTLLVFALSILLLAITPGPDTFFIVSRSTALGMRAGFAATFGVSAGILVHTMLAALGVSALLAASPWAFEILKLIGGGYLIYVGVSLLIGSFRNNRRASAQIVSAVPLSSIFLQGFLTNVLNPKVALFFIAFLPQFVPQSSEYHTLALICLVLLFNVIGTLWNGAMAWVAARSVSLFKNGSNASVWLNRVTGTFFIAFGIRIAFSRNL